MNNIAELIPHRKPFLFVDTVISVNNDEIVGTKTYDDPFFLQGHFPEQKLVPGPILIESMAQCGGAGVSEMGVAGRGLWGLAIIENAQFLGIVEFGKTVKMVIRNLKVSKKVIKQSGTVLCDGKVVAQATWMCAKII